jgi:hypothetical protein
MPSSSVFESQQKVEVVAQAKQWWERNSGAVKIANDGLAVVDRLLAKCNSSRRPSKEDMSVFMAATAFAYGVWENYVEQLAIEIVGHLSEALLPERVPPQIVKRLEDHKAWALTVHPGWKELWRRDVKVAAIGNGDEEYGLNTARHAAVTKLFSRVGIDPWLNIDASYKNRIDELVGLRGEIVHTVRHPTSLNKAATNEWRSFIANVITDVDATCLVQCQALLIVE